MELKLIKNTNYYHEVLHEAERLVALNPELGSLEANQLELLTVLIEDYERREFPFPAPDAIDAIEFRMQEQGLRQIDLVPMIGSKSRVSEILARKRPLTVPMIRALSTGLGIPLETLITPSIHTTQSKDEGSIIEFENFPVREMQKRGWIQELNTYTKQNISEVVRNFLAQVSIGPTRAAMYRRNFKGEEIDSKSYYSVLAWTARVLIKAKEAPMPLSKYEPSKLNNEVLKSIAQLSWLSDGPKLAIEFLAKLGIIVVVEPPLPNTLIDGAAMMTEGGTPVIGLTLRYDRIDYFWFTLLHELAHVWKHLNSEEDAFIDRIENMGSNVLAEKEANRIARDACIPRTIWKRSDAFLNPTKENIVELANELHVHPAIVAGRIQFDTKQYGIFQDLLGRDLVRVCFPEVSFS
jgi:HTH-type transcriptional regulator/antitoxin HigA